MSTEPSNIVPANRNPGAFLVEKYRGRIEEALGYTAVRQPKMPLSVESFGSAVANDLLRDRTTGEGKLWKGFQDSPEAALAAMLQAAQMKLMPGTCYGLYWLIPYFDHGRASVRGEIGYKGYAEVAQRHPRVHSIQSVLVYKGERFSYNPGTGKCDHEYDPEIARTLENVRLGYLRAVITEESTQHAVLDAPLIVPLTIEEILKRRACSQSWNRSGAKSIWGQWPIEQAKKTVMKHGLAHGEVPKDMGLASAISEDGAEDALPDGEGDPIPSDRPTRGEQMRQRLGMSSAETIEVKPFATFEQAERFVSDPATSLEDLRAARDRLEHLSPTAHGEIMAKIEDRERESGGEP